MGEVVVATCACGYKEDAVIGAGRSNFKAVCKFPHYCKSCNQVTSIDLFKTEKMCTRCGSADVRSYESSTKAIPYKFLNRFSDDTLKKYGYHRKNHEYTSWHGIKKNHVLMRGTHYCPNCKCNNLSFQITMMFD